MSFEIDLSDFDQPAAPAKQKPKSGVPLVGQGGQNIPFYFDLETVPDWDREPTFGLEPVAKQAPEHKMKDCPPPAAVVTGTVAEVLKTVEHLNPELRWLELLAKAEKAGKGRKTIMDLPKKAAAGEAESPEDARRKLLSVTPEYCRIAAMGWACDGDPPTSMLVTDYTEREILDIFWQLAARFSPVIGFNILGFDLPVIYFRSALLGVTPTKSFFKCKPWEDEIVDLYQRRFGGRKFGNGPGKLKELAPLAGIEVPAGDVDGSQVEAMMKENPDLVAKYVESDVHVTRELHKFYRGFFC